MKKKVIIVGITGASGITYGITLLKLLKDNPEIETHLVVSRSAHLTLKQETNLKIEDLNNLADIVHNHNNIGASIASGSFSVSGMIIAPCSVKTMADISNCSSGNLITRAADICLKERRRLVMMFRETPLHLGHLRHMANVTEMGAIICPPVPAFYANPKNIEEMVIYSCQRVLDLYDIQATAIKRWDSL